MFKISFICQQPIVKLLAQPAIKIELYPVYQSQDNEFAKGNFKDFSGTDPE